MKKFLVLMVVALLFACCVLDAFAGDVEKALSLDLAECSRIVKRIAESARLGVPTAADVALLKKNAEDIQADRLLLAERQSALSDRTSTLGITSSERLNTASSSLLAKLDELLTLLNAIGISVNPSDLDALKQILDSLVTHKSRPLLGVLPYRHTNYPPREPAASPVVKPAYKGGNLSVTAVDIATTSESPLSKEIVDLAQSLQWNPVLIYEWVKNNVETEWYWGSMKGAEETLRQKSGNDADQATLLVALLRASNFPARYIKGTIEFFPDLNKAKNLTGLDDPVKIHSFLQKAGIPVKPVIAGGAIANFQIEHVWVEAFIPYSNYRGAVVDDQGKIWLGLDTSIKPQGYTRTPGAGVPADILAPMRDDYLNAVQTLSPLDVLKGKLNESLAATQPLKTWSDLKDSSTLIPDVLKIIPSSLQFPQIAITGEYQTLPDELKHKVAFSATAGGNELLTITVDALNLSNRTVALRAEPETVEDQNTIDSFGGLDNTPPYLVRLRPVLTLDGERLIVAQDGLPMGADFTLNMDIITPNGTERFSSSQINGNLSVIGVVAQKAATLAAIADTDDAEAILHKESTGYIDRWNKAEDDLAALLGQSISRPTVSIATVGAQLEVTQLLDTPHDMQWKGLFLDAGYRRIETVGRSGNERDFMRLSALQGSILENRIFEDDLKVDSVSTAKLLQQARTVATPVITIDKMNVDTVLPQLAFDDDVKSDITNAVNQGLTVTIPQVEVAYQNWSGIGYIKEDPATGESGWMLSGQVAGGMTAWLPESWDTATLKAISTALRTPYSGAPNIHPEQATRIFKIPVRDQQIGVVGKTLKYALQVKVTDQTGRHVKGVPVTFTIKAGGGTFDDTTTIKTEPSDALGIAQVTLVLGQKTSVNPSYWFMDGNTYSDQYGVNIVDAALANGTTIATPFSEYGAPGALASLRPTNGVNLSGVILSYAGFAGLMAEDSYGNPIANQKVSFNIDDPAVSGVCKGKEYDHTPALLIQNGDTCINSSPTIKDALTFCTKPGKRIDSVTSTTGSWVGVILGGAPGATYPITATAAAKSTTFNAQFTPKSYDFTTCNSNATPKSELFISSLMPSDIYGHIINAGRSGSNISIMAKEYLITEELKIAPESLSCNGATLSCSKFVGNHTFATTSNFYGDGATALFNGVPVKNLGNGLFQGIYTLKPGLNTVTIEGLASYAFNSMNNSCSACASTPTSTVQTMTAMPISIMVYGVDIAIRQPLNIMLDGLGASRNNLKISYSINPSDYQAANAFILLYKITETNGQKNYEQIDYISVETKGSGYGTFARGYHFDETQSYAVKVVINYGSSAQIMSDPVPITIAKGALIPDYNHNRKIDDEDLDRALNNDPYYFWVNDDDGNGDTEGSGIPGSGSTVDPSHLKVDGTRDLVDFFPVYLDLKGMFKTYDPATHSYRLRNTDSALNYVVTDLGPAEAGEYLTGEKRGIGFVQTIGSAPTFSITDTNFNLITAQYLPLKPEVIEQIKQDKGVILIEAYKKATNPLVLEIYKGADLVFSSLKLNLSIDGIEKMFRHKNLVQDGGGPAPSPIYDENEDDRLPVPPNFPDSETNGKNFVFVHGYNVNPQKARGTHAEIYKRMYWSGSQARFWGITWYGYHTQIGPFTADYHVNVTHALDTAPYLRNFLNSTVQGEISIAAHSLGNMVVSTMLSDNAASWDNNYLVTIPVAKIKNYFMIDAAVAIEAYDAFANQSDDMKHYDWINYKKSLWASEWHQHFVKDRPNDYRANLTWRGRFKSKPSFTAYYNFYSSGEEILATLPFDTPITELLRDEANNPGIYAWALQEKLKGANPLSVDFAANSLAGWGFNLEDFAEKDPFGKNTNKPITFLLANDIPDSDLKVKPFFKKGIEADLYEPGSIGSTYATNNMNRLLGSAIPALTLPTGANTVTKLGDEDISNFDMDKRYKNDKGDWPQNRGFNKNWKHSDIKNVSYPYIYNIFNKFIELGGF